MPVSPLTIVNSVGSTARGSGSVTVTAQVAVYDVPSTVMLAVIVAVPAASPVTTPSLTVATVLSLVVQVTSASSGLVVAVSVNVASFSTVPSFLSRVILGCIAFDFANNYACVHFSKDINAVCCNCF